VLTLLTSLTLAFLVLSSTEPTIATNLKRGEEALALAEAGIERAIWALTNPAIDTAGANTKLSDLAQVPAAYTAGAGQSLFTLGGGVYSIAIAGAGPVLLTGHGYVLREGVAAPTTVGGLPPAADIAAHRMIQLQVTAGGGGGGSGTVGGAASPGNVTLPGALTVSGTLQMGGSSVVNGNDRAPGTPNSCSSKFGVTIRDKSVDGTTNTITTSGASSIVGSPTPTQTLPASQFDQYTFTASQLAALKALAQAEGAGHYIKPTSNDQFDLTLVDGLMFVDTVNGADLGTPPDASKLAKVKITGMNNSGWLIVMGSIRIDGNAQYGNTYGGFIYAHNDISYKGSGPGGIFGAMLSGNVVDSIATVVDSDTSGNANVYYDCTAVATGGGAFSQNLQDALNRRIVSINKGTWREVSN